MSKQKFYSVTRTNMQGDEFDEGYFMDLKNANSKIEYLRSKAKTENISHHYVYIEIKEFTFEDEVHR